MWRGARGEFGGGSITAGGRCQGSKLCNRCISFDYTRIIAIRIALLEEKGFLTYSAS
jgi:hypothetical protein